MKYHKFSIYFLILIVFLACNKKTKRVKSSKFTGLWSLYIMEQQDTITGQWKEWRDGMQGYILYDNKDNMAVHLTTKGYQNANLKFPNFVDTIAMEALKHLTKSYVYFAKYKIHEKDSIVEHARFSHSNPADWNKVVRRKFSFIGDTLILRPVENKNANLRLKWIKQD